MATQQIGVAGMTLETRTFYDKNLLSRTVPNFRHRQFGTTKTIPANSGVIISVRRFTRPAAATTALTEGTPPTPTNPTVTGVTATIAQYGAYMLGSDLLEWQAIDPVITELTTVFSEQMQDTLDQVTRGILVAGTNVAFAGTATVRSGIASGANLSWAELRNARRVLAAADVPTFEDGRYGVLIHPNVVKDLFADTNVVNAFQYAANRGAAMGGDNPLQSGALGDLLGLRFYESSNAGIVSGLGQSARDIYQTLFFGRDAYITTELTSDTARTYFKARGTAGPLDPLDQYWSLGWKAAYVAAIVDQNRILRYETASSTS